MDAYHTETIEHAGFRFKAEHFFDDSLCEPWREHCDHGVIAKGVRSTYHGSAEKRPGQVQIDRNERDYTVWLYDVPASIALATRDGWGLSDDALAKLRAVKGREPTPREVVVEAVRLDMERMRAWLHDKWHWVGVVVTLLGEDDDGEEVDTDESESLWGLESDDGEHLAEVAAQLAEQIAQRIGREYVRTSTVRARRRA